MPGLQMRMLGFQGLGPKAMESQGSAHIPDNTGMD